MTARAIHLRWLFVPVATIVLAVANTASADLLTVGTGLNALWDRASNPAEAAPVINIPLFNDNTDANAATPQLKAWQLELGIVPQGGAVGSFSIDSTSFAVPATSVITSAGTLTNNPAGGNIRVSLANSNFFGASDPIPTAGKSLLDLSFTASPNASGNFDLVAFNIASGDATNWTDDLFNDVAFGNVPAGAGSQLTLGTITVSAIPEPGSLALALLGSLGVGAYGCRRRRAVPTASPTEAV